MTLKNFDESLNSPCLTCQHALCCNHLLLKKIKVNSLIELDQIRFFLNFSNIRISLDHMMIWSIYYHQSCRFFDAETRQCTVHNQKHQPNICKNYNPYGCLYKKINEAKTTFSSEIIWMNNIRLECFQSYLLFDNNNKICSWPEKNNLLQEISKIPYSENMEYVKSKLLHKNVVKTDFYDSPCDTCKAYCCSKLIFPRRKPSNRADLDYFKYCLGFKGIQVGISDTSWNIIVTSSCKHLFDYKCSIFGQKSRPIICKYFDPGNCDYKRDFSEKSDYLRVEYEELLELYQFDENGNVLEEMNAASIKDFLKRD